MKYITLLAALSLIALASCQQQQQQQTLDPTPCDIAKGLK